MSAKWKDAEFRELMSKRPRLWRYDLETQQKIATRFESGESASKLAREYGCRSSVLYRIVARMGVSTTRRLLARRIDKAGYCYIYAPDNPMALSNGYVLEHRLVMSQLLGRPLTADETVHHVDGNKQHNAPENLQLMSGRHGKGVALMCRCCGSTDIIETRLGDASQITVD